MVKKYSEWLSPRTEASLHLETFCWKMSPNLEVNPALSWSGSQRPTEMPSHPYASLFLELQLMHQHPGWLQPTWAACKWGTLVPSQKSTVVTAEVTWKACMVSTLQALCYGPTAHTTPQLANGKPGYGGMYCFSCCCGVKSLCPSQWLFQDWLGYLQLTQN